VTTPSIDILNCIDTGVFSHNLTQSSGGDELERVKGIEPCPISSQGLHNQELTESPHKSYTQIRAHAPQRDYFDLPKVINAWPSLSHDLKMAILAIVNSCPGK